MKLALRRWLLRLLNEGLPEAPKLATTSPLDVDQSTARIHINKAMNGHIVQVLTYKHNPHGPDWTGDLILVPDGADLMEAIKIALVAKAIS
jgi:hypothetical protein